MSNQIRQAWITVTSREYEPLCRLMVRSLLPVTGRPVVVCGVDYLPEIPGTLGRTLVSGPENLGFARMRAIAETIRAVDLALAIHVDSDVLFGAPADMFWDLPAADHPLMPWHCHCDLHYLLDGFSREICLRLLAEFGGGRQTTPYVHSCFHVCHRDSLPALDFMVALGRKLAARGNQHWHEEAAWNAWLWRHGRRRTLPMRSMSSDQFAEHAGQCRLMPFWHGMKDRDRSGTTPEDHRGPAMRVALSVIATGKYTRFLCGLLGTAYEFFCPGHDVRILVFSDSAVPKHHQNTIVIPTPHEPWPGPTLHRYRTMLRAADTLEGCDYVYYLDVDSRFVRPVGEEVFGDLAATVHYGFCEAPRRQWTYETRYASRAHVAPAERGRHYYCGGFQGGRAGIYLAAMRSMAAAIDDDERRGITACWHDESHWNRYLIDHPPDVELSHDYMCPEPWRPDTQRIVIVGKNNGEMRQP